MQKLKNSDFLKEITGNTLRFPVKIISSSKDQTIIDIKGHRLSVPFFLSDTMKYSARFNKNGDVVITKELSKPEVVQSESKNIDVVFNSNQKEENDSFSIFNSLFTLFKQNQDYDITDFLKKQKYIRSKKTGSHLFIVNTPVYQMDSKVLINISNDTFVKLVFLFYNDVNSDPDFKTRIITELNQIVNGKIEVSFVNSEDQFKKSVMIAAEGLDFYA